jgi:hypothetical protein
MTKANILATWSRYMHRNDLSTDLDQVYEFAGLMISQQYLGDIDLDELGPDYPRQARLWQHAGLMYLNELAQDDASGSRESQLFQIALRDYAQNRSAELSPDAPQMKGKVYAP